MILEPNSLEVKYWKNNCQRACLGKVLAFIHTNIVPYPYIIELYKLSFKAEKKGIHNHIYVCMSLFQKYYLMSWVQNNITTLFIYF